MWALAVILAIVILVQSAPKPKHPRVHPHGPAASLMTGGLRGGP
jgi:hypothetical protein